MQGKSEFTGQLQKTAGSSGGFAESFHFETPGSRGQTFTAFLKRLHFSLMAAAIGFI
jgi:hypothetical protein